MSSPAAPVTVSIPSDFPSMSTLPAVCGRSSLVREELSLSCSQISSPPSRTVSASSHGYKTFKGAARRPLGILLLLMTVFLWTTSNFLASTIFADNSYSKPYFVTYCSSSLFSVFLLVVWIRRLAFRRWHFGIACQGNNFATNETEVLLKPGSSRLRDQTLNRVISLENSTGHFEVAHDGRNNMRQGLDSKETARLSLEFFILWFAANYFIAACLRYTTVASSTILMSTSSIWTLLFGTVMKVEKFTLRKLIGIMISLVGIILISTVDLSGDSDKHRGRFPHKSPTQVAIGDTLALGSAALYGFYTALMKNRIGDEARVDMLLFFGFVGAFNIVFLWPGLIVLHYTGVEPFELPSSTRIWAILLLNSVTSLISDFSWAYALLLTSPLVVTVGLSLSIPLSLIGQIFINLQTSSITYWTGAGVVLLSFVWINDESKREIEGGDGDGDEEQDAEVDVTRA